MGNFDGVHLGHLAVVRRAVEEAGKLDGKVVAATFDPHPGWVLRSGKQPKLLTTLDLRREALLRCGADEVYAIRFDRALSEKSPEEFVRDVLVGELGAVVVVVGENFRFGHKAAGGVDDLRRLMRSHGGEVVAVALQGGEEEVNSTRIRALISSGEVGEAAKLLRHPYVLRGEGRGRRPARPDNRFPDRERPAGPGRGRSRPRSLCRVRGRRRREVRRLHQHRGGADLRARR